MPPPPPPNPDEPELDEINVPKYLWSKGLSNIMIYSGELLHHKTILIDEDIVLTGTCNFFNASINRHEEVYMRIKSRELKNVFETRFETLTSQAKEYVV